MITKNILTKIILSDLHLYFFYAFVLSIPFQIRKRFLTEHSYFAGGFSEHATFFIYLSDVLLILAIFFWAVKIITNSRDGDSSRLYCKDGDSPYFYCIKHAINRVSTIFKSISKNFLYRKRDKSRLYNFCYSIISSKNKSLKILFVLCLWLIVDLLLISGDYFFISAYQTVKFLELATLFIYIYFNLTSFKRILTTVGLLALSGLTQSLLAISQYFFQHSIFGSKWLGEIVLNPELPGVAKIIINGEKIMRAYGTFPHPNILASFLLIATFLSGYLLTNYPQLVNSSGKNRDFSLFNTLRKIKGLILSNKLSNLSSRDGSETRSYDRVNNVSRETLFNNNNNKKQALSFQERLNDFKFKILNLKSIFNNLIFKHSKLKNSKFNQNSKFKIRNLSSGISQPLYIEYRVKSPKREIMNNVSRETLLFGLLLSFLIFIQILALILTFSRSGWLGFFVVLLVLNIFYLYKNKSKQNVSRETLFNNKNKKRVFSSWERLNNFEFKILNLKSILNDLIFKHSKLKNSKFNQNSRLKIRNLSFNIFQFSRNKFRTGFLKKGYLNNVSRETFSNYSKIAFSNKNTLNILFLVVLTAFSVIYLWPEISSRNLSKDSLNSLTVKNLAYHKKEFHDYSNNVSRETLLELKDEENQIEDSSIMDRLFYSKIAIDSINKYPFTGTGLGTFVFQIDDYLNVSRETLLDSNVIFSAFQENSARLESWRYQPVHNIYLLIASEIGIIGFLIFAFFIIQVIKEGWKNALNKGNLEIQNNNVSRETLFNNENKKRAFSFQGELSNFKFKILNFKSILNNLIFKHSKLKNLKFNQNSKFKIRNLNSNTSQLSYVRYGVKSPKRNIVENVSRETFNLQKNLQYFLIAIFVGFLVIGMFDHYFWTIQQGRFEFWLILGLIAANGKIIKK